MVQIIYFYTNFDLEIVPSNIEYKNINYLNRGFNEGSSFIVKYIFFFSLPDERRILNKPHAHNVLELPPWPLMFVPRLRQEFVKYGNKCMKHLITNFKHDFNQIN